MDPVAFDKSFSLAEIGYTGCLYALGKMWEQNVSCFSGQIRPDWGISAWAATAGSVRY